MAKKTVIFGTLFVIMSIVAVVFWFASFGGVANSENVNTEWEYLVVTSGKIRFGSAEKAQGVEEKFHGGVITHEIDEAVTTEGWMDELGNRGWELVDVVGLIGGEQEFIFKRKT